MTVIFDAEPPVVTLTAPVDGGIVRSPFRVAGTLTDTAPVVLVDVNGEPVMVDEGVFETTLSAVDGVLPIRATAQDAAGNAGSAEIAVTVDARHR